MWERAAKENVLLVTMTVEEDNSIDMQFISNLSMYVKSLAKINYLNCDPLTDCDSTPCNPQI